VLKRPTRDKERDMFRVLPYLRPYATQQRVAGMGFSTLPPSSGDGLTVQEAIRSVKENAKAKFDETIELALGLGLDPRKANQNLRSSVVLPHGTGKSERVAVFAQGDKVDEATEAGAAVVGGQDLVDQINSGNIDFTRCIATPDMMPMVGRVARILGPKGLMPNPKTGTVTADVGAAVSAALRGQVQYRVDKFGYLQVGVGKVSFSDEAILENLRALMMDIADSKPDGAKGKYLQKATLSSTMGKGHTVDVGLLDATSPYFLRED
jgi:large subunit ribosomal protein L1